MIKELMGANLQHINFRGVDFTGANLRHINFRGADFTNADLTSADFTNADLTSANLTGARLYNTIGDGKVIKTINLYPYIVNIVKSLGVIQIGCKQYTAEKWFKFCDFRIRSMDENALEWWREHKQTIKEEWLDDE